MRTAALRAFRIALVTGTIISGGIVHAQVATDQPETSEAETAQEPGRGLQEIVVTAERRETNLQETPISITALTEEELQVNRVQNLTDLSSLAPGLTAQRSGSQNSVQYQMRGESSQGFLPGQASGIGTYIDGVYVGLLTGTNAELADFERIEVLRGPQGTLFGQNSTGGAISIITRQPSGEFSGVQEFTYGNFDHFRSRTRVDLPAFGPFSISLLYLHNERDGDTRNFGAGTQWDFGPLTNGIWGIRTAPETLGAQNNDAWGVNVLFEPSADFEAIYRYDASNNVFTDRAQGVLGDPSNIPAAFPFGIPGTYFLIPEDIRTPVSLTRPEGVNNYFSLPFRSEAQNHTLNATLDVSEHLTLRSISGYRDVTMEIHSMLDGARGGSPITPNVPFTIQSASSYNDDWMLSTELQALVSTDLFDLTAGLYYFKNSISNGPRIEPAPCASGACSTTNATQPYVIRNTGVGGRSVGKSRTTAVYAQANIHITDRLDAQLGLRQSWDRTTGIDALSGIVIPLDYKDDRLSWLAGLNYRATDDLFLYAKASRGYIRGGQLGGIAFDPQVATSYEAGVKADLFNRTLRTNLSVYHVKYVDVQQVGLLAGAGPGGGGLTVIFSVGDAKVNGFELESTWITPVEGLTLSGSLSHTDYKYVNLNPTFLLFNGLRPDQMLSVTPEWTGSLALRYEGPEMGWGRIAASVDGNFYWDKNLTNSWRTPLQREYIHVDHRYIVNARLAVTDIPVGRVDAEVALWARNLFDADGAAGVTFIGYSSAIYEQQRTYGVDVTFRF